MVWSLEPYKEGVCICSGLIGERILAKCNLIPKIKPYWKGRNRMEKRGKEREESVQGRRGREGRKERKE